jgi:hypothetical protein
VTATGPTRAVLHDVAVQVLARRRFAVSGRFGLRAGPGGISTPAFGEAPETVRLSRLHVIREVGSTLTLMPVNGSTLRDLARFVDADLDVPFSAGDDTPPMGPVDVPLDVVSLVAASIEDWFSLAWLVLDDVLASLSPLTAATTIQLWPEHFDAATTVTLAPAQPVNLGFSPGDGFESEPYVYVGPWDPARPGDPRFWNAPFGAVRRRDEVLGAPDPAAFCRQFLTDGLRLASSS